MRNGNDGQNGRKAGIICLGVALPFGGVFVGQGDLLACSCKPLIKLIPGTFALFLRKGIW